MVIEVQKQKDSNGDQLKSFEKEEYERKLKIAEEKFNSLQRQVDAGK